MRFPSLAIIGLLAVCPATLAAQCADGSQPPCRTTPVQRPAAVRPATTPASEALFVGGTEEILFYAISQYEQGNLRRAIANLRNVMAPTYMNAVRSDQKVTAYLYLGASYAELSLNDSARVYFVAALYFDAFVELRAPAFRDAARAQFEYCKGVAGRLGVRPMPPSWLVYPDSAATAFPFKVVTTATAQLRVELVNSADATQRVVLLDEASNGPREIKWLGQVGNGRLAEFGTTWQFRAEARFPSGAFGGRSETMCFTVTRPGGVAGQRAVLELKPYVGSC